MLLVHSSIAPQLHWALWPGHDSRNHLRMLKKRTNKLCVRSSPCLHCLQPETNKITSKKTCTCLQRLQGSWQQLRHQVLQTALQCCKIPFLLQCFYGKKDKSGIVLQPGERHFRHLKNFSKNFLKDSFSNSSMCNFEAWTYEPPFSKLNTSQ